MFLIFRSSDPELEVSTIHSEGEDEDYSQRKSFTEFLQLQTDQGKAQPMLSYNLRIGARAGLTKSVFSSLFYRRDLSTGTQKGTGF